MKQQLIMTIITFFASIIAASLVMIIHEFVKAMAYKCYTNIYNKKYNKLNITPGLFRLYRYIDPVGLILSVTNYVAFSRQYPFIIKSKKASFLIGAIGYFTLAFTFSASVLGYRALFATDGILVGDYDNTIGYLIIILQEVLKGIIIYSIFMLIANLFPLSTFDISLIVAAVSPTAYIKIRKFDLFYKLLFMVLTLLGVFSVAGIYIANYCLTH